MRGARSYKRHAPIVAQLCPAMFVLPLLTMRHSLAMQMDRELACRRRCRHTMVGEESAALPLQWGLPFPNCLPQRLILDCLMCHV